MRKKVTDRELKRSIRQAFAVPEPEGGRVFMKKIGKEERIVISCAQFFLIQPPQRTDLGSLCTVIRSGGRGGICFLEKCGGNYGSGTFVVYIGGDAVSGTSFGG